MIRSLRFIAASLIASFIADEIRCNTCSAGSDSHCPSSGNENIKHINIVLFGSTGNLAKKYLWSSLFEVYKDLVHEKRELKLSIYATGREEMKDGRLSISNILLNLEKCLIDECSKLKKGFTESIQYVKVATVQDFVELESKLDENTQSLYGMLGSARTNEIGRLFFLAIPPSAYGKTTLNIHKYLRPKIGNPWIRIIVEKPFGSDLDTAVALNNELWQSFDESQVYRVDHYLGKTVVKEMLPFRLNNADKYGHLWNSQHIERVDVVLKEREDVVGRTGFYNENGVLRDVMQNHMTEMLALTAMELPASGGSSISEIHRLKLELLSKLKPSKNESTQVITGQYSTYNAEWLAETKGSNEVTEVPTFAAAALFVDNDRWRGVPFVLLTGKKLDEKSSYVRVIFKDNHFCPGLTPKSFKQRRQIIFYIGGHLGEAIAVSPGLPMPDFKSDWVEMKNPEGFVRMFGQSDQSLRVYAPGQVVPPYTHLIKAALEGARHLFVPSEILYESWKFWTPLIRTSDRTRPRKYLGRGIDHSRLEFLLVDSFCPNESDDCGVKFMNSETMPVNGTSV